MLTILIPTITGREKQLDKLVDELKSQCRDLPKKLGKVSITICPDNRELSIGAKRQQLLESCKSLYCVFIDDDDILKPDYLFEILTAIKQKPDCVGFKGVMTTNGKSPAKWEISSKHKNWHEKNGVYYRHINHLSPIKTKIALSVGFEDVRHGEDRIYSMGLVGKLNKEVFIDKELYIYNYQTK